MPTRQKQPKSPLVFLASVAILTVATLVVASAYFLQPNIESELKGKLIQNFIAVGLRNTNIKLSGRDVTLSGFVLSFNDAVKAEEIAKHVSGVREVNNQLMIKKQSSE